jgi:choline dehydrogenase-like flavoprotein
MPEQADIIVIGAGVAGMLVASQLAQRGAKVLVLEAGPRVDRAAATQRFQYTAVKTPEAPYEPTRHAPQPSVIQPDEYYVQAGADLFRSTYQRRVGGTTWHWLGTALRHTPNDFRLRSTYGVGADWPIDYGTLEPWYSEAEQVLGVAGDSRADLGSPRSRDYPMPPIPMTYVDKRVAAAAEKLGLTVHSTPQARNSREFEGRPACCGNSSCVPICPIGAKYDATVHVEKAEKAGAELIDNAVVLRLEADDRSRIVAAVFRRPDGPEERVAGKLFVLAAHAIESPKLLLMSRGERHPHGLANSSDQVGRNLMDHPTQLSWALAPRPVWPYRGPLETSGIEDFRDGDFRHHRAAFRIPIGNDGWSWPGSDPLLLASELISQGVRGEELDRTVRDRIARQLRLASLVEQLPDPENRIVPDFDRPDGFGVPRPRIAYRIDDYTRQGMAEGRDVHGRVFQAMSATAVQHREHHEGAGHIMGTLRMGADAKTSVVDAELRSHDHANLFVVGGAVFPSAGTANPTLTIAGLSLRCAETIHRTGRQL